MAKHRNNPNMPFWKMIKEGYDHFEVTKQEPKVDFCEKKYVFDATKPPGATRDPVFDASAKCPAYVIPDEIANGVREKQQQEAAEVAKLISKGTPMARMNTGIDGGMNKIFASKLPEGSTGLSEGGDSQSLQSLSLARAPGTIPSTVNPPKPNLAPQPEEPVVAVSTTSSTSSTRVASATPATQSGQQSEGFFSSLARKVGLGATADANAAATSVPPSAPAAAAKPKAAETKTAETKTAETKPSSVVRVAPKPETKLAAAKPALKPSVTDAPATSTTAAAAPATKDAQLSGSQPIVQPNSFDSRFGAVK
jgi:hypothetical protein